MSRAPPPPHKHRRQHTHLNDGIWMANVCNPATVCGNVELPFNGDTQTTCWPLATNTMFELPVIWTPTFGGTTTKHITQRDTSPNLSRTNSEPCRVHLSMLSCADPAHATWVCNTTTNNVKDTPPTFQNNPLHHGHTSSDVRSTNAVREAWSTFVSRPAPRQPNCKRPKTHKKQFASMLRVVAAARSRNWFPQITMSTTHVQIIHAYISHHWNMVGFSETHTRHVT